MVFFLFCKGIIAGPGEFAEGVARGVRSLLGHVIGNLSEVTINNVTYPVSLNFVLDWHS